VNVGTEVGAEFGDVRPLSIKQQNVLRVNYARLVELINSVDSGLLGQLTDTGVITGQLQQQHCHHYHHNCHHLSITVIILCQALTKGQEHRTVAFDD